MGGGRAAMSEIALRTRALMLATPVEDSMVQALRQIPGVEAAEDMGRRGVRLRYDVRSTGVDILLAWLAARGVHGDRGWRARLRHGWMAYADAVAREALTADDGWESWLRGLYARRLPERERAQRVEHAHHWRRYLARTESQS